METFTKIFAPRVLFSVNAPLFPSYENINVSNFELTLNRNNAIILTLSECGVNMQ